MFWKLNKNERMEDLAELTRTLAEFFDVAVSLSGPKLDEAGLQRLWPQNADWFLAELNEPAKNREDLKTAVAALMKLPVPRRRAIASAVAHDVRFHHAAFPKHFFFWTLRLPAEEQELLEQFFTYFYEVVFHRKGYPELNGHTCRATRTDYLNAYFKANSALRQVCPVCLHQQSSSATEDDLEHYFPKAVYPVLELHPYSLTFLCKPCNQVYKRAGDALNRGGKSIGTVFLPYQDTVREHVTVSFRWDPDEDKEKVKLLPAASDPAEEEKVNTFARQFQLEERWTNDIERTHNCFWTLYSGMGDKAAVRKKLEDKCEELHILSSFPELFLESAYADWLFLEEFDAFFANLTEFKES